MALRRSCHPTQPTPPPAARAAAQLSALPVAQQCTQMPRNGVERPFSAICVHYCVPTGHPRDPRVAARAATVYTNGPEPRQKAVFYDLCTLLRHHGPPARPSRRNSVHKYPRTAPRNHFRPSVYTIASPYVTTGRPRDPRAATVYTNGPEPRQKVVFGDLCTLLGHHGPPA